MMSLSVENQCEIIEAFSSTSELQLNRANSSDTEAPFFGFESMYI